MTFKTPLVNASDTRITVVADGDISINVQHHYHTEDNNIQINSSGNNIFIEAPNAQFITLVGENNHVEVNLAQSFNIENDDVTVHIHNNNNQVHNSNDRNITLGENNHVDVNGAQLCDIDDDDVTVHRRGFVTRLFDVFTENVNSDVAVPKQERRNIVVHNDVEDLCLKGVYGKVVEGDYVWIQDKHLPGKFDMFPAVYMRNKEFTAIQHRNKTVMLLSDNFALIFNFGKHSDYSTDYYFHLK